MLKKSTFILALGCATLLASCTKKGDTGATGPTGPAGPTGPTGPAYTGAISGHVSLYDQYGTKVLVGVNSVSLSLNGAAAINPDTSGYYIYDSLKTGVYNIVASASGYAATKANDFQFLSDTLNKDIKLSVIPAFSPTAFTTYPTAGPLVGDSLVVNFTPDTRARNYIIFLNNTATVNGQPANYLLAYSRGINANALRSSFVVPAQDLYDAGFTTGQTVYYAVYGYVVGDVSAYEDLATGKTVFNAISSSSLSATAIVP